MFRKENGVTLVALVITIIVLLILAGVTISMVLGDDGILSQASDATESYAISDMKEKAAVAAATVTTKHLAAENDASSTTTYALSAANVKTELEALLDGETITVSTNTLTVVMPEGTYTIPLTIGTASISVGTVTAPSGLTL